MGEEKKENFDKTPQKTPKKLGLPRSVKNGNRCSCGGLIVRIPRDDCALGTWEDRCEGCGLFCGSSPGGITFR